MSLFAKWIPRLLMLGAWFAPLSSQAAVSLPDEVELGYTHDGLDNGYSNWNNVYLDGAHQLGEHHSVYGELRETHRFDLRDREVSGGYYQPLNETWTALVEASYSPDHNVLPKNSLFGQLQKAFSGGWDVQAGLRHNTYTAISSNLMVLTGEHYWGNYRAAYKLYLSKLQGAGTAPSHNVQLSYYYAERDNITLNFAKGRQVESLGQPLGVLAIDVTSTSLSGRHWLNSSWGVSYEAIVEHQGGLYTRKGFRLGLRYAF
jgi:YaiO family outer membrane protein